MKVGIMMTSTSHIIKAVDQRMQRMANNLNHLGGQSGLVRSVAWRQIFLLKLPVIARNWTSMSEGLNPIYFRSWIVA